MGASVVINLDTTAPIIELDIPKIFRSGDNLILAIPYSLTEPDISSARLFTSVGEIQGTIDINDIQFDITQSGSAGVNSVAIDVIDDVLNYNQITLPLVLRDLSRILTFSIKEKPFLEFDSAQDPIITWGKIDDPSLVVSYTDKNKITVSINKDDEIGA